MPELPAVSGKEAIKAFEQFGFTFVRKSGSHYIMKKPGHRFMLSVPLHGNASLKMGTLRSLIEDAGVSVEDFVGKL